MDLLITVVGLLVAVYAVIPRARRLDLRLRFGALEIAAFAAVFISILYLDLYSFFKARHLVVLRPAWLTGLTTVQATHVLVITLLVTLVLRSQFARLTPTKIFRFQDLAEELLWSEAYVQLLTVLETHLNRLFKIYHADFWPERLRRTYSAKWTIEAIQHLIEHPPTTSQKLVGVLVRRLDFLLPRNERWQMAAAELVPKILSSKGLVSTIARSRPYFGLEIIRHLGETSDGFLREEFFELYIEELMSHRTSVFYAELANSRIATATIGM